MRNIIFRTMGGKGIGYGHFYRCLSLAKAFKAFDRSISILFLVNNELKTQFLDARFKYLINDSFRQDFDIVREVKPQLFILDSYLADNDYLTRIKKEAKTMILDDNNDIYDSTIPDILLNGNIHAKDLNYKVNHNSLYLLGSKYLVMKEEYWEEGIIGYEKKDGILVTTGGTDPFHISYDVLNALKELPYRKRVIIGPGYDQNLVEEIKEIKDELIELVFRPYSLKEYISESKLAITAGGSTMYELLSQKTLPIIFSMADNQDIICKYLERYGVLYLGKYPKVILKDINEDIKTLMEDKSFCNSDIFSLVDGQGAKRVVRAIYFFFNSCRRQS